MYFHILKVSTSLLFKFRKHFKIVRKKYMKNYTVVYLTVNRNCFGTEILSQEFRIFKHWDFCAKKKHEEKLYFLSGEDWYKK